MTSADKPINAVADIVRVQARLRPDSVAQVFEDRRTTYAELDVHTSRVAQGLIADNCGKGTRIGYIGKGSDFYFEVFYGAAKVGAVPVAINWRLAPPEISFIINDAAVELLFVGAEYYDIIESILPDCPRLRRVIALDGGHKSWPDFTTWRDSFPATDPMVDLASDDDVIQLYTSGTTGHPKGVQLTNANYVSIFKQGAISGWANWRSDDNVLVCMPLFHVAGVNIGILGHLYGCKNIVLKDIDPKQMLKLIERERITIAFIVPAVILFLLLDPEIKSTDVTSLRQLIYGASPIAEELLKQAQAVFNADFVQLYGLTETTGGAAHLPARAHDPAMNKLRSCGLPNPDLEIAIFDENDRPMPPGQVGEIVIRGGSVMKGYWNREKATQEALRGGWFRSGDAGYFDEDGYLFIYDRVKDMIVSGGENIYPAEVENALFGHPAIADVAVIGVPDEKWGEAVKAMVVLKADQKASEDEIIEFTRSRIARYKVPKSVEFVIALPRNPSGKILRRELRKPYWEGRERMIN